jgi:hypothetical protein
MARMGETAPFLIWSRPARARKSSTENVTPFQFETRMEEPEELEMPDGLVDLDIVRSLTDDPDALILVAARQYFYLLRQAKGWTGELSPLDLEILVLIRFISTAQGNFIDLLCRAGLIIIGDRIVIHPKRLGATLVSGKTRINVNLRKLHWHIVPLNVRQMRTIIGPVTQETGLQNWTMRIIPHDSVVYRYVRENSQIRFTPMENPPPKDRRKMLLAYPGPNWIDERPG